MTPDEIKKQVAKARELAEKATPGPWRREDGHHSNVVVPDEHPYDQWVGIAGRRMDSVFTGAVSNSTRRKWEADASFIASSRELVPALCDTIEYLMNQQQKDGQP